MAKKMETGPDTLYKVEFWEENMEKEPVFTAYVMAKSQEHAKNLLKWRGYEAGRGTGKVWLSHLFRRPDVLVTAKPDEKWVAKQNLKRDLGGTDLCPECGEQLDDDYCQSCGWRRDSWLSRARKDIGDNGEKNKATPTGG